MSLSSSSSSLSEESQALLMLKTGGLQDPLFAVGGLGGVSATTYKLGVPMETLEHVATGDLLLLLLCGGMSSCSPSCTPLSAGGVSATGLMWTLFAWTHKRRGGLTWLGPGMFAWILAGVQELHLLSGFTWLANSLLVTFLRLTQLRHCFSFLLLSLFRPWHCSFSLSEFVAQAWVVPAVGAIFRAPELIETGVEHPEHSEHYSEDSDRQKNVLHTCVQQFTCLKNVACGSFVTTKEQVWVPKSVKVLLVVNVNSTQSAGLHGDKSSQSTGFLFCFCTAMRQWRLQAYIAPSHGLSAHRAGDRAAPCSLAILHAPLSAVARAEAPPLLCQPASFLSSARACSERVLGSAGAWLWGSGLGTGASLAWVGNLLKCLRFRNRISPETSFLR